MKFRNSMLVLAATLGTSALLANPAAAQEIENIGNQGQFVIGAERITGLFFDKIKVTPDGADDDQTTSVTRIALLGSDGSGSPSSIPRLGFDYLVTDGLSVGGSLFVLRGSAEFDNGQDSTDQGSQTAIYINPRVGYAYAFDDTFAIWPRGGIAFTSFSGDNGDVNDSETSGNSLQLTVEGNLVISPFEHFAFLVGPFLDLGLSGSSETESDGATAEEDQKFTSYGITAGIAGYFGE
ncbi:MAG TPA: hypothetical protein VI072_03960 [Polyangiaceae bacterium]